MFAGISAGHDSYHSSLLGSTAHLQGTGRPRHCCCDKACSGHTDIRQQGSQLHQRQRHPHVLQVCAPSQVSAPLCPCPCDQAHASRDGIILPSKCAVPTSLLLQIHFVGWPGKQIIHSYHIHTFLTGSMSSTTEHHCTRVCVNRSDRPSVLFGTLLHAV